MPALNRYTVLLAYPDNRRDYGVDSFQAHVRAANPDDAVAHAREQCIEKEESGEWGDPPGSDLEPIAVFKGWLEDLKP
jgi:hypothetical protein